MAITRSQQAKQMLQDGGMLVKPGFGGTRQGYRGEAAAASDKAAGRNAGRDTSAAGTGNVGGDFDRGSFQDAVRRGELKAEVERQQKEKIEEDLEKFRRLGSNKRRIESFISKVSPIAMFASRFGPLNTRDFFLENYLSSKNAPMTKEQFALLSDEDQEKQFQEYMKGRLSGETDAYGNLLNQGGGGDGITQIIPMDTTFDQASSDMDQESEEDDKDLRLAFRANGGRIGFFKGAQADTAKGKAMSPGTTASGGFRGGGKDGPSGPSTTGGGGGVTSIIKEKPPVNIVKEKSNIQKIMDIFGLSDDNDPKSVSLGTGLAEQAKQDIIKDKEIKAQGMSEAEAELRAQGLLAIGGRVGLMEGGMPYEGGIMDLESARQMYGLGKLVKKVTRSVKKIAKSPLGKAALLSVGAFGLPGGAFGMKGFLPQAFKTGASKFLFGLPGGNKLVDPTKGLFGVGGKLALGKGKLGIGSLIGGASLVSGLLTAEQEEEAQQIADETGIDIAEIRANPDKYLGRRFRAEGGSMKEPVAKKTMPLLDMDGQEMDFRAEGGFVPIGRMEKADDVPARLSKNEFVFTADAVRNAGDGSVDKGAEVMYNMMKNLEAGGDVSEESQGLEGARKMFQTSQRLEEVL